MSYVEEGDHLRQLVRDLTNQVARLKAEREYLWAELKWERRDTPTRDAEMRDDYGLQRNDDD